MSLLNVSPDAPSDLRIPRSRQFMVQSEVKLNCKLSHITRFLWHVYQVGEVDIPLILTNGNSELKITPHLLPVGIFLVQLTISMVGTPVFGVSRGYFEIVRSPLVAYIAGGTKVTRGRDRTLILDASMSHDPDEENHKFSG